MDIVGIEIPIEVQQAGCWSLIDFEPDDPPPWHQQGTSRSVDCMIKDIVEYQKLWEEKKDTLSSDTKEKASLDMERAFFLNINKEEDIGVQDEDGAGIIVKAFHEENKKNVKSPEATPKPKDVKETLNLCKAWRCLTELAEQERNSDPNTLGLMDVEECIQGTHKILMTGVVGVTMTPGGKFSEVPRSAEYNGEVHFYPVRKRHEWKAVLDTITDRYNTLVNAIKHEQNREKQTLYLFKCAAWFLYSLVSEHPFSDGNGRLCRLLASYTLCLITPFPSPIYNMLGTSDKKDFVDCIVTARKSEDKHPRSMAALIIESNWYAWRSYLGFLGLHKDSTDMKQNPMY